MRSPSNTSRALNILSLYSAGEQQITNTNHPSYYFFPQILKNMSSGQTNTQISEIRDKDIPPLFGSMVSMKRPLVKSPNSARHLPGCRPCGLHWDECEVDFLESDNGQDVVIHFRLAETIWTRKLNIEQGQLRCNLQELETLRWAAERETTPAAIRLGDYRIQYVPQRRYPCLFPHQATTAHDIMEIVSGTTSEELKNAGEEAIRDSVVLLCPAPASLCMEPSHTGAADEVCKLATYWPTRQILCAPAVEGMIDIGPVSICRDDPTRNQCIVLETSERRTTIPPTEIRTNEALSSMHFAVTSVIWKGRNNPQLALHPSWHGEILSATQDAVLQCQHRRANTQPTRLYDAHENMVKKDVRTEHYLALSYCWEEWPEDNDDALKAKLEELSRRLAVRYFWVDRMCVNQQDDADKAREIARMREYYTGASGCVVLAGPEVQPFWCLPKHNGAILSAYQQVLLNSAALQSLISCKWASRVWTLQEALLSRQLVYSVQDQLVDGDFISELVSYVGTFSESYSGADDPEWIGGYGSYRWNARATTIVYPRQFRLRQSSTKPPRFTIYRTIFGGELQYEELQLAGGVTMPFEDALAMVTDRHATRNEDNVYGLLGICEGGDKISVEYNISWKTMLAKLQRAGMITERQLASSTVNELPGMSWLPHCGSGYGPFKNVEMLAAPVCRPELSISEEGITVFGALFEWESFACMEWGFLNIHGMACRLVRATIRFPETPGLVAEVGGTTTLKSGFKNGRMNGTHVMLCRDVDEKTPDTVAIKVSGDIEGGLVQREDGYVLELHRWLEGNPRLLKGRQWMIF